MMNNRQLDPNVSLFGQLNMNTILGQKIYELVKQKDVKTILDEGLFKGEGSSRAIYLGIVESGKKDYLVYSLECNEAFLNEAKMRLVPLLHNFNLVYGTIVDAEELYQYRKIIKDPVLLGYLEEDIRNMKRCPNVFNDLPKDWDLVIIDGGEFEGKLVFEKLYKNSKYIVLDDTKSFKNKENREFIINNPDIFEMIYDGLDERGGCLICKNKTIS